MRKSVWAIAAGTILAAGFAVRQFMAPTPLTADEMAARWATPLPAPTGPMATYHLGHSLVGHDMPALLGQMAGHDYASQLGWGASMMNHWENDLFNYAEVNSHPNHRPVREAFASGDYGAVVFTEMVELKDAIRWHYSPKYLAKWAREVRGARPDARIYLYETWHWLDDPAGWEKRIAADLEPLWMGQIIGGAMAYKDVGTVHLIPGGQVMAEAVKQAEAGNIPGLTSREDLYGRDPEGKLDPIHFGPKGAYLIALTHFAVIYQRDPTGLPQMAPAALRLFDGKPLDMSAETATELQKLVWQVVRRHPATGLAQE